MANISCMGFNILSCDTHDSGFEKPADRFHHVVRTIREQAPDLLGVQEACNLCCSEPETKRCFGFDWCEPMIKAMDELGYDYSILRDQEGFKLKRQTIACGLIIFFKKDRFELKDSGCAPYSPDQGRYYQWVKLLDKEYERSILFTNTHFSINPWLIDAHNWILGNANRTVAAGELLRFWYKNCDENTALFATGDYNCDPRSDAQGILRSRHFKPSNIVAEIPDEHGTCNGAKEACTIDFCYVNPKAQTVKEYKVIKDHYESEAECRWAGYASDHRALMTYCDYNPIEKKTEE